ncbi:MAG TPA: glycosyltransferase family 2 protein [Roseomonas sp.]|nr:glycosyltransferase family 2 protein [Roseomonas sp.]
MTHRGHGGDPAPVDDSLVSVVIATHDRPEPLARLLRTVVSQTHRDIEVIVVDDQSSEETLAAYPSLLAGLDDRVKIIDLPAAMSRRAPSITRNYGIRLARGAYVAFCDDDDTWIRDDHLAAAVSAMQSINADLHLAEMQTVCDGSVLEASYYGKVLPALRRSAEAPGLARDVVQIPPEARAAFLNGRTPHANTIVVRRDMLIASGLYWERLTFAEDHDMAFRLFDAASRITFRRTACAALNVADHPSVARSFASDERSIFSIAATLRASTLVNDSRLRSVLRSDRAWRLLELAETQAQLGQWRAAREFAAESFRIRPTRSAGSLWLRSLTRT